MEKLTRRFNINCNDSDCAVDIAEISSENGIDCYRLTVTMATPRMPSAVEIQWEEPMNNILHVWTPLGGCEHAIHQSFCKSANGSKFYYGAPILCTIGADNMNRATVSVSDGDTPVTLYFYVDDFNQNFTVKYGAVFFDGDTDPLQEYTAILRIDSRALPYYQTIQQVNPWWERMGYIHPSCPECAELPLYSSWYNFHQSPKDDALEKDLALAAEMGFRTVILDDGWQIEGVSKGDYSLCGEWKVAKDKFSDFAAFTRCVHSYGMKLIVWFAVPFIGFDSPLIDKFEGKYLYKFDNSLNAAVLDPRYPEVRRYITDTYEKFLTDYDIDGFKLDFIDSFHPGDLTAPFGNGMDCETVESGVKKLLDEITFKLGQRKADLLYEYRQGYIGPSITRYGNMLRVGDCAYDAMTNRIGIVALRLLGYPLAVHSDMLYWSKEEAPELCAKQMINILFGVPQISVILQDSTSKQKKAIEYYVTYWNNNRDILLHGEFSAPDPQDNYPYVYAEKDGKRIAALYSPRPYVCNGVDCDLFNGCDSDAIYIENAADLPVDIESYDCFGVLIGKSTIGQCTIVKQQVPVSGMLRMKKKA